jgi:threonine aldolase
MTKIDLRSDTVTLPSAAMRSSMAEAEVGDDVYGEDPTVNRLQEMAAKLIGMESALFVSSGTQGNLLGILSHCERGDEYIVGGRAHTFRYEGGGAAVLGSVQPQPVDFESDGTLDLDTVLSVIKPADHHFARTRLLCLENTQEGKALPLDYLGEAAALASRHGLGTHLDGARMFNAAVKLGVPVTEMTQHFDTVSFCLSKGLGAPVGSVLCGSHDLITKAHRWRKVLGGGMRQAGILAAAGIYALANNVARLAEDHAKASAIAEGLRTIEGIDVEFADAQTNMVYVTVHNRDHSVLSDYMNQREIVTDKGRPMRLVTHLDIQREDVPRIVSAFADFVSTTAR